MGHMGQGQPGPMGGPNFAAWGMNDVTAQFGMQLGQSAVAAGQDYVQKNVRRITHRPFIIFSTDFYSSSLVVLYH
jgi:hypothetical protein